jgi:hypothetical protein
LQPSSKEWDKPEALQRRLVLLEALRETEFPAFLETLEVAAAQPVPPSHSSYPVLNAKQDGSLETVWAIQEFWDFDAITKRLADIELESKRLKSYKPVGHKNPYPKDNEVPLRLAQDELT